MESKLIFDLQTAIVSGDVEAVSSAIKSSNNDSKLFTTQIESFGATLLHLAASRAQPKIVELILQNIESIDLEVLDSTGGTPLFAALASSGPLSQDNHDTVRVLIDKGANVNVVDKEGLSPLHEAASNGDLRSVEMLLESGANCNKQADSGVTPLHMAAVGALNRPDFYKILQVSKDATMSDIKSKYHELALKYHPDKMANTESANTAKLTQDFRAISMAYKVLANSEARDAFDNTFKRVVQALLVRGADLALQTNGKNKDTAQDLAIRSSQWDVAIVLANASSFVVDKYGRNLMHHLCAKFAEASWIEKAKECPAATEALSQVDASGYTPFLTACSMGNEKAVGVLLKLLDDSNKLLEDRSNEEETPLILAVKSGNKTLVELLYTNNQTNLRHKDSSGMDALAWAEAYGDTEIIEYLKGK